MCSWEEEPTEGPGYEPELGRSRYQVLRDRSLLGIPGPTDASLKLCFPFVTPRTFTVREVGLTKSPYPLTNRGSRRD